MTFRIGTFVFHCKSEHKQGKTEKLLGACANPTVFFLIYKVVHYWNDFWNLFLDKVNLKIIW